MPSNIRPKDLRKSMSYDREFVAERIKAAIWNLGYAEHIMQLDSPLDEVPNLKETLEIVADHVREAILKSP